MSDQAQVASAFNTLWNGLYDTNSFSEDELGIPNDNQKLLDWSVGLLPMWVSNAIGSKNRISILDAGCGLGYGIKSVIEVCHKEFAALKKLSYHGIDLIDLSRTKEKVKACTEIVMPDTDTNVCVHLMDMIESSKLNQDFDIILALGSLHHTPSVEKYLASTFDSLKPGGTYIGWIINEQKPLRACTDKFFRGFFSDATLAENHDSDLTSLAQIFLSLGNALNNKEITLTKSVNCLGIEPGTYRLQSLLYDYFLKCYFKGGENEEGLIRVKAQLYDWFVPIYYHQTSRNQLESILASLNHSSYYEICTSTNGHFFKITKA